jgi:hypothetical protein
VKRRVASAVLLVAGAAGSLYWAWQPLPIDGRQIVSLDAVLLVGLGLNFTGLLRRHLPLRLWLRVLALLVVATGLAGVVVTYWFLHETLGSTSPGNLELRQDLGLRLTAAARLGLALAYVVASLALLPPERAAEK